MECIDLQAERCCTGLQQWRDVESQSADQVPAVCGADAVSGVSSSGPEMRSIGAVLGRAMLG